MEDLWNILDLNTNEDPETNEYLDTFKDCTTIKDHKTVEVVSKEDFETIENCNIIKAFE